MYILKIKETRVFFSKKGNTLLKYDKIKESCGQAFTKYFSKSFANNYRFV